MNRFTSIGAMYQNVLIMAVTSIGAMYQSVLIMAVKYSLDGP